MGLISANILPLLKEHALRPFSGHVLCLGYPRVGVSRRQFELLADIAGVREKLRNARGRDIADAKDTMTGPELLASIGFDTVSAMDYSGYEGASIRFDLNSDTLPDELIGQFDVVIDHGTIEHVFHIPNVMRNIWGLLAVSGRVFHSSPGTNFFDHGFYMLSPTFFHDYYAANRWRIDRLQVYQMDRHEEAPPFFADYWPGLFARQSYGGLDDKMYGTICIATKLSESTGAVCPLQHAYATAPGWLNREGDD